MNGLVFLKSNDFFIQKGTKGLVMCHRIPELSLILFYSPHCQYCQQILPTFKQLPGIINGCRFGVVNVSTAKECIKQSKDTIAPILYVPYIILYFNGKPYMSYKGEMNLDSIRHFIVEISQNMKRKEPTAVGGTGKGQITHSDKNKIPDYTIGVPIKGFGKEMVTYLEWDEAYIKN